MKRWIVFLTLIAARLLCYSQTDRYTLHPLVGDTIDKNEKFNYLLFKNINDEDFKYGILTHTKEAYFIKVCSPDNVVSTMAIDSAELKQYIAKLDLVQEYYANEGKKDSIKITSNPYEEASALQLKEVNSTLINKNSKDRIMKEVRTGNRLKRDAERYKNRNDHSDMFSGAGYVEFPAIKTKKRK